MRGLRGIEGVRGGVGGERVVGPRGGERRGRG